MDDAFSGWSWLGTIALVLAAAYLYLCFVYSYWERRGIPAAKAKWFLGSFGMRWNEPQGHIEMDWYMKYGKVFGIYEGLSPVLMVADPDLLKDIFVKDFNKLPNQKEIHFGDEILSEMVVSLEGNKWRRVRSAITPIFSSSRIKKMSLHIQETIQVLEANLKEVAERGGPVDCTKFFNAFTMDSVSRCGFDVILDNHNNPNNPFVKCMEGIFDIAVPWRIMLNAMFPRFCQLVRLSMVDKKATSFFYSAVLKLLEHRKQNPQENHEDFLQYMLNCSHEDTINGINGKEKRLSRNEIIAQSVAFFMVGFVTTAATLGYAAYSLASHGDCQEKLYREIEEVMKDKEKLTYNDVQNMKYLDAVISETLRYYTPVPRIDRWGEEDYVLGNTGIVVPKRLNIGIPVYALHHDPELFPEPEKFNPDRFLPESGHKIYPYSYLPFSIGPRNCVGMKFSQMEMKMCLASVFRRFRFSLVPESKMTMDFGNGLGVHRPIEAIVKIERRL